MITDDIVALAPVIVPAATALIGWFVPSPGPIVVRYSAAWWASLVQTCAKVWQSKPAQAVEAAEISPATLALINQAVAAAVAALAPQTPTNAWLATPNSSPVVPVVPNVGS